MGPAIIITIICSQQCLIIAVSVTCMVVTTPANGADSPGTADSGWLMMLIDAA
jgi:hypothetical protein